MKRNLYRIGDERARTHTTPYVPGDQRTIDRSEATVSNKERWSGIKVVMDEGVLGIEGRDHKEEAEPDEVEVSEDGPVALSEV